MTINHCTAYRVDPENLSYPLSRIAEDEAEYTTNTPPPRAITLPTEALRAYITHRLGQPSRYPTRLLMLFDDLNVLLREKTDIDVFDLLVEANLIADETPALQLCDLLAVLDESTLRELEPGTIAHTGEFVRDVLKQKMVRWTLQDYHDEQKAGEELEE